MRVKDILTYINGLRTKSDGTVYTSDLMPLIKSLKNNHDLALELWRSGSPAAREIAVRIADVDRAKEFA